MGLFGGGNSTSETENDNTTNNVDNRVGVDGGGSVLGNGATQTTINQVVDSGTATAAVIGAGLVSTTALMSSADVVKAALDSATQTNKDLAAESAAALNLVSSNSTSDLNGALSFGQTAVQAVTTSADKALDINDALTQSVLGFASDVQSGALAAVAQTTKDLTSSSQQFVEDFSNQLATTSQSSSQQELQQVIKLLMVLGIAAAAVFVLKGSR